MTRYNRIDTEIVTQGLKKHLKLMDRGANHCALQLAINTIEKLSMDKGSQVANIEIAIYDTFHNLSLPSCAEHGKNLGTMKEYTRYIFQQNNLLTEPPEEQTNG